MPSSRSSSSSRYCMRMLAFPMAVRVAFHVAVCIVVRVDAVWIHTPCTAHEPQLYQDA